MKLFGVYIQLTKQMSVSGMMSLSEMASSLLNCSSKHSAPELKKRAKDEGLVSLYIFTSPKY